MTPEIILSHPPRVLTDFQREYYLEHGYLFIESLINAYASADAFPYTDGGVGNSPHYRNVVRGQSARWAEHDSRPCPIPPDWSASYPSLYEQQALATEAS